MAKRKQINEAASNELLSTAKQDPMPKSPAQVQVVGGPTPQWSTADYANFKFDAAVGVSADSTIRSTAQQSGQPSAESLGGEADKQDEGDAPVVENADEDAKADAIAEEDDAASTEDAPVTESDDNDEDDMLDIDLAELADDDVDLIELGPQDDDPLDEEGDDDALDSLKMEDADADADDKDAVMEEGDDDEKSDVVAESDDEDADDSKNPFAEEDDKDAEQPVTEEDESEKKDEVTEESDEDEKLAESKIKVRFSIAESKNLFAKDTTLTEEQKRQSKVLFESAVRSIAKQIGKQIHESYEARYQATKKALEAKTVQQMDQYLTYVVEQWAAQNKVALRSQINAKLTENFMRGLKTLFTEHYIDVPESKVKVVETLARNVKSLKQQVRVAEAKAVKTHAEMKEAVKRERKALVREHKARLIAEAASALPASERGKFAKLAENVSFTNTKAFKKDLTVLREQYQPAGNGKNNERPIPVPPATPLLESVQPKTVAATTPEVSAAAQMLDRMGKRQS